jgi:hypothetical protein
LTSLELVDQATSINPPRRELPGGFFVARNRLFNNSLFVVRRKSHFSAGVVEKALDETF